ncbi:aldose 1-epimerase family protein [Chelatococcus reniformis]|uniref:Aldose 1-epimerase n=1 Tax=Chelatococcus reniformis TaxID=1494448 RepID=A0A916UQN8_9HYPH|nr:aldose 1-epimerase family protein [Chelatococcus reniformis]GGC82501.1 aldose 1-epimerase [Chelatococcus reniformis]
MQASNDDRISIKSDGLFVEVATLGAEMVVLRDGDGRDLLWNGDPAVWSGHAPLLFPIVGALAGGAYRIGREVYRLPQHGFARRSEFSLVERHSDQATLRLTESEATRAVYPFPFRLDVTYALAGSTLSVTASVTNTGRKPLPFSLGFHPAFCWPLPYGAERAAHTLTFDRDETAPVVRPDADGLLTRPEPNPVIGRTLPLSDALLAAGALVFKQTASRRIVYGAPGGPSLVVDFPEMTSLGIWTKPGAGAPYICIEPWQGYADDARPAGADQKPADLFAKPGIVEVAPTQSRSFGFSVTLAQGG